MFFVLILVVIGLIHFYLWKRLVRDPLRPGRARRIGGVVAILLAVLVPATLIGTRSGYVKWLAWPGYIWVALMFYLLVALVVLEIPRLLLSIWIRVTAKPDEPSRDSEPASNRPAAFDASAAGMSPGGAPPIERPSERSTTSEADLSPAGVTLAAEPTRESRTTDSAAKALALEPTSGSPTTATANLDDGMTQTPDGRNDTDGRDDRDGRDGIGGRDGTDGRNNRDGDGDRDGLNSGGGAAGRVGIDRRLLLARGAAIFAGLTAASVTGYGVKTALGPPQLDRVQLPLAKLPRAMDGTRLAVVSDIHLGPLTGARHAGRIVELINSVDADIVCIVGDLVDGSVAELGRFAAPLADIKARQGAYFVTGNHEYYSGYQEWVAEVARLGVRPLRNERLELGGLDLAGVNDLGGTDFGDGPDLGRALGDRDPARPVVLMAHQPVIAHDAAAYGVDLQVSGHTHGGQMAPFNLLVALEQPVVSGFGVVDGVPVYVTNGAGFWGPPVRVGAPPQVTVIELRTP